MKGTYIIISSGSAANLASTLKLSIVIEIFWECNPRGSFLGLFSVEFMACDVTVGWVAPSVHIANGVKKSYSSLDVTCSQAQMLCAVVLDAHMLWHFMSCCHGRMGIPIIVYRRYHGYGALSLHVYKFVYLHFNWCLPPRKRGLQLTL